MATTKLYVIHDTVANDIFGAIIRAANDEVARRSFHDLLSSKESPLARHEGDYNLLIIGRIDNTGVIYNGGTEITLPAIIARGADWLAANKLSLEA